jgi:hypothetical protein
MRLLFKFQIFTVTIFLVTLKHKSGIDIVLMKVSYGRVLSLLLSVILSLSKVKRRQKIDGQDHLAT